MAGNDLPIPDLTSWTQYEKALYKVFIAFAYRPRTASGSVCILAALPFFAFGARTIFYGAACCGFTALAIPALAWCSLLLAWFPRPRGPYSVGSRDILVKLENHGGAAHLCARLFYPSSAAQGYNHEWLPEPKDAYSQALGGVYGLPPRLATLLLYPAKFIRTRSTKNAPFQAGSWPVVLFSHGLCGTRTMYSSLCTEVASHGYLVVAPEHTDGSAIVTIAGNQQIHYTSRAQADRAKQLQRRVLELQACWQTVSQRKGEFEHKLNLKRCILMGHSFGAATVACAHSAPPFLDRSTLVLLDPWLGPAMSALTTAKAPALVIMQGSSMLWPQNALDVVRFLLKVDSELQPAWLAEVVGARHQDASDVPFFMHIPMALVCASSMTRSGQWMWRCNSELIQQFLSFHSEDEDTKRSLLVSVTGARIHKWKSWLRCTQKHFDTMRDEADGAIGA